MTRTGKPTKGRTKAAIRRAKKTRPVSVPPTPWDHGATGPANRIGLAVEERGEVDPHTGRMVNPNRVTGVRRVDMLAFWLRSGTLTAAQVNAAERLRDAYEMTLRQRPCLPENDRVQSSPKPDETVAIQVAAMSRFAAMMAHVRREDREIVTTCVLEGRHPSWLVQYRNLPGSGSRMRSDAGFAHLRGALDHLHGRV